MISEGQVVLFKFPQTNQAEGKLRPALVLRKLPGKFDDWLICMISSQTHHHIPDVDEPIKPEDDDYIQSGLKNESIIRLCRLAVVESSFLIGKTGQISSKRLMRLKQNLCKWLVNELIES